MDDYDYTYPTSYLDEVAGPVPTKTKVMAAALRGKPPRVQSSSIAPTTAIESVQPKPSGNPLQDRMDQLEKERQGLLKDQDAAYAKPDYSGYGSYAQQRQDSGSRALVMALAAQEAGMQPFQAYYLRQAAEARAPMKVTGGTITDTGFVEDVGHAQELDARRVDARIKQIESQIQFTQNAQERARLAAEANDLKRMQMENTLALRGLAAGTAASNRQHQNDMKNFQLEDRMKAGFETVTKNAREGLTASQQVRPLMAAAAGRALTNVEQQALITLFNKFLDPESVVREGEFNRMAQGMGLVQRIQNWSAKITSGSIITPQMAAEIGRVAGVYEKDALRRIHDQSREYETIASKRGLDSSSIITNPAWRATPQENAPSRVTITPAEAAAAPAPAAPSRVKITPG